jgi:hypothetical protein
MTAAMKERANRMQAPGEDRAMIAIFDLWLLPGVDDRALDVKNAHDGEYEKEPCNGDRDGY